MDAGNRRMKKQLEAWVSHLSKMLHSSQARLDDNARALVKGKAVVEELERLVGGARK